MNLGFRDPDLAAPPDPGELVVVGEGGVALGLEAADDRLLRAGHEGRPGGVAPGQGDPGEPGSRVVHVRAGVQVEAVGAQEAHPPGSRVIWDTAQIFKSLLKLLANPYAA